MHQVTIIDRTIRHAVYGTPDAELSGHDSAGFEPLSPLAPGATAIESLPDGGLETLVVAAPPGSIERRYVLAHGLRALAPGGKLVALALKDKGGARLAGELRDFGCQPTEDYRRRHRICTLTRPEATLDLAKAIAAGSPVLLPALGLWSQPGVFSWDRPDPGSLLLMEAMPAMAGQGADLGCGIGLLSHAVLAAPAVSALTVVDIDRRAVDCARHNVNDPRVRFLWADARQHGLAELDFVVSNPPFHAAGVEDRGLGQDFIRAARRALRKGGTLWLVANRHLPYEAVLNAAFRKTTVLGDKGGYKLFEASA